MPITVSIAAHWPWKFNGVGCSSSLLSGISWARLGLYRLETPVVNDCPAGVWVYKRGTRAPLTSPSLSVTMSFAGKYQLDSQENFEPFMKALGKNLFSSVWFSHVCPSFRKKMQDLGKCLFCVELSAKTQTQASMSTLLIQQCVLHARSPWWVDPERQRH